MKVVMFNGSPRKNGNTSQALKLTETVLTDQGIETEIIRIGGTGLHGCIACYKCMENKDRRCGGIKDDPLNEYLAKMIDADGIVIGTPTYFGNVSTEVKALIDRCGLVSRMNGSLLSRKVGVALAVARRAGAVEAIMSINHFFLINDVMVPGSSYWNFCIGQKPGDIQTDQEGLDTVKRTAENMAWMIRKLTA